MLLSVKVNHIFWTSPSSVATQNVLADLQDYFNVVKRPMDMGYIKKKLEQNGYYSAKECIMDFRQIFNNCYTYNKPTDVRIRSL